MSFYLDDYNPIEDKEIICGNCNSPTIFVGTYKDPGGESTSVYFMCNMCGYITHCSIDHTNDDFYQNGTCSITLYLAEVQKLFREFKKNNKGMSYTSRW